MEHDEELIKIMIDYYDIERDGVVRTLRAMDEAEESRYPTRQGDRYSY